MVASVGGGTSKTARPSESGEHRRPLDDQPFAADFPTLSRLGTAMILFALRSALLENGDPQDLSRATSQVTASSPRAAVHVFSEDLLSGKVRSLKNYKRAGSIYRKPAHPNLNYASIIDDKKISLCANSDLYRFGTVRIE